MKDIIDAHLRLVRPNNILDFLLLYYLGVFLAYGKNQPLHVWLPGAVAIALAFFFSNAVNDVFDADIDSENGLKRPISEKIITKKDAKNFAYLSAFSAILLGMIGGISILIPAACIIILGICYSHPKIAWSRKGFAATLTMVLAYYLIPFWSGYYAAKGNFASSALASVGLAGLIFLNAPRLLLKDYRDRAGDKKHGKNTPLAILGGRVIFLAIVTLEILANILLFAFYGELKAAMLGNALVILSLIQSGLIIAVARINETEGAASGKISVLSRWMRVVSVLTFLVIVFF